MCTIMYFIKNLKNLLLLSEDIEANQGPKESSKTKFFHWNLMVHFAKVPLLEAFIKSNSFDILVRMM